nr:NBS-LRR disease resistance protein [Dasypyrum villosum]
MVVSALIGFVASTVASHLWTPVITHMRYLIEKEENIGKLDSTIRNLEARKQEIQIRLMNSERKQETCNPEVAEWLEKVAAIESEVNEMKHGQRKRRAQSFSYWSNYETGMQAAKKLKEAEMLHEKGSFKQVSIEVPPCFVQELPTIPSVQPTDCNLSRVLQYLKDDRVGIVGVWGMGGVGKTTLLRKINNHFLGVIEEEYGYDLVIYAVASKACGIGQLQADISEKIGLFLKPGSSIETRASVMLSFLRQKKFLLLLDDLWNYLDLAEAGIPYPNGLNKQKVILATRYESVRGHMDAHNRVFLECLDQEKAWKLFKEKVSEETINSDPRIEKLAHVVAEECGGLPLALVTIGSAMSTKKSYHEWALALSFLKKSRIHEIPNMWNVGHLYSRLKLSYDYLQDKQIKECFLCCSLWPEDYSIWKVELIDCWMGMGLIEYDTMEEGYNKGYSIIEYLKDVCLLETGYLEGSEVRVHDILRDMSLWISSDCSKEHMQWIVQAGIGLYNISNTNIKTFRSARNISLMCNYITELPQALNCPNLQFLSLQQNFRLKVIPPSFLKSISSVTYLDLSWVPIKELPEEIGILVELQYLTLKQTHIRLLPIAIGLLRKLKFLDMSYMDFLEKIPYGVFTNLSMLQVLNLYGSRYAGREADFDPANHMDYDEFRVEELSCLSLGITAKRVSTLQRLFDVPGVYLRCLGLYELNGERSLTLTLTESIFVLNVMGCSDLEDFYIMDKAQCYGDDISRLEFLTFWDLPRLEKISMEHLQNLRVLTVGRTYQLVDLSCILKLPHLEHLNVSCCDKMKQLVDIQNVIDTEGGYEIPIQVFRQLRILQLNSLQSLDRLCNSKFDFPSLEYIDVFACPRMKKLPFGQMGKLKRIRGEQTWWDNLEWDDESSSLSLLPFFKSSEICSASFRPELDATVISSSPKAFFSKRQPMLNSSVRFTSYPQSIFETEEFDAHMKME